MATLYWSREATSLLLEIYAQQPCLYVVGSGNYHNRTKRNDVYNIIVNKLKRLRPQTTVRDVKTKINSLRTQFNLENTKVLRSQISATSPEEIYKPTLWCFNKMLFLKEHVSKRSVSTLDAKDKEDDDDDDEDDDVQIVPPKNEIDDESTNEPQIVGTYSSSQRLLKIQNTPPPSSPEDQIISNTSNPLPYICEPPKSQVILDEQYDNFSRFVASELRTIVDHDIFIQTKRKIQLAILDAQEAQERRRLSYDRQQYYLPSPSNSNLSIENYYGSNSSTHDSGLNSLKSSNDTSQFTVNLLNR